MSQASLAPAAGRNRNRHQCFGGTKTGAPARGRSARPDRQGPAGPASGHDACLGNAGIRHAGCRIPLRKRDQSRMTLPCSSVSQGAVQERRPAERSGSGGQDDAATGLSSSHDRSPLVIYAFSRGLSNRPVRGTFIACSGSGDCGGQVQGEPEVTGEQVPNCRPLTSMATARPDNIQHYRPTRRCIFGLLPPFVLRSQMGRG
jgi:hypothetical protein